jgi:Rad3-related DNA helicase
LIVHQGRAIPGLFKWNVLVTTYEMVLADSALLKTVDWRYTVIDEAHRLKNKVPSHLTLPVNSRWRVTHFIFLSLFSFPTYRTANC